MKWFCFTPVFTGAGLVLYAGVAYAGVTASTVVDYTPGNLQPFPSEVTDINSSAALGPLTGDTGYGALNPFNPAYQNTQIVAVGLGGQLTLQLSNSVSTAGGANLGIFNNNGIDDESLDGSGQAGDPATTFDDPAHPEAIVSVSSGNGTFVPLNGGNPIIFENPANYYLDQEIADYYQATGSVIADQFKPFTGTLSSFDGETYDQIKTTLDGSAGGTWLDLSGTGLTSVSEVRFTVPANAGYSFVVDSVSAVPEPVMLLPLLAGGFLLRRTRRR